VTNLWEKIFRKKSKKPGSEEDTIPLKRSITEPKENDVTRPLTLLPSIVENTGVTNKLIGLNPSQLIASCAQSVGRQRHHNEDAMFCLTTTMSANGNTMPFGLYIVADGMGGHQHGEIASEIATRTMAEHIIQNLFTNLISIDPHPPEESLQEIITKGIQKAHDNILEIVTGGGTTLTTVIIFSNQMTIAHVGDSRVYSVSLNGKMKALTRDHSLVRRLEELGQLTSEEAAVDPRRNVLYHALGQGTPLDPEVISAPSPHPGYLLVCSDGLWGVVSEEKIGNIIKSAETLPKACQEMIDAANEAGGPDNITAILVRLPE
jgi:serine/threonine protein phosphatase PrpC